jgi:hypothetical protein
MVEKTAGVCCGDWYNIIVMDFWCVLVVSIIL